MPESELSSLRPILEKNDNRLETARHIADWIAAQRGYHWVGLYEVTTSDIGMLACTGSTPPAFPRFPITQGLCGAAVAAKSIVNSGNVQEDPRWLTTFGTTRSEIIIPVLSKGSAVVGLIDVESDQLNAFDGSDEKFLSDCASLLSPVFL